jgi:hypothetical protein
MKRVIAGACIALASACAAAADTGELWEVSTKMEMAGLPAGMGAHTARVCNETGDPRRQAQAGDLQKCKITDYKQSGNKVSMTLACPEGTAVMEHVYNAAHTEYKGSMKMTTRDGEKMTMNMSGRKVGACDVQQAKRERDEKVAEGKRQVAALQAQQAASQKAAAANCAKAVETMNLDLLDPYGRCERLGGACEAMKQADPRTASACMKSHAELCKRYQTMDGFLKANGSEEIAQSCKLDRAAIVAAQCPRAQKSGNLAYLGRFCPTEAKPIAQEHCAGRGYTSRMDDKHRDFCSEYLARSSLEEAPQPQAGAPKPQDAVTQGVKQGINKLKGLFGR